MRLWRGILFALLILVTIALVCFLLWVMLTVKLA